MDESLVPRGFDPLRAVGVLTGCVSSQSKKKSYLKRLLQKSNSGLELYEFIKGAVLVC